MTGRKFAALAIALMLGACAARRQELVVVLPNPDGSSGAVTVNDGQNAVLLDHPYAADEVKKGVGTAATADSGEVNQVFGTALAAQPIPPAHFRLYFPSDATTLAPTSDEEYPLVFKDIKRRTVYEVEIVGHTDTMGPLAYNQELSLKRAKAIKKRLVRDGLDPNSISVAGRGQLDLAVKTGPRVSEAKNRRVEITVR